MITQDLQLRNHSEISEARCSFDSDRNQSKVILITSSQPQDGKSFIAFNLAASIASVGYKTIILDCDLRRPTLHVKFKEDNRTGLSAYMVNRSSEEDIIQKTFNQESFLYSCRTSIA